LSEAGENLLLVSPFVKRSQTSQVISNFQSRGLKDSIRVVLITDVRPESALSGATDLEEELRELKILFRKAQQGIRAQAQRAFKAKLEATHVRLLRQRVHGRTTHAIFSEAILFLLAKGPLPTSELHPLIQGLHPDICDDSIDRIIDGEHFGKKWKHYVRNAQQSLKQQGRIRYDGERWHIVS
jgi:hypothetical protein